jgi:hypothetical protein
MHFMSKYSDLTSRKFADKKMAVKSGVPSILDSALGLLKLQ